MGQFAYTISQVKGLMGENKKLFYFDSQSDFLCLKLTREVC